MHRAKKQLKKFLVPHHGNNYHPHLLHSKRALFYSAAFLAMKAVVVMFVVLLPSQAFLLPDVLAEQERQILALTNAVRAEKGLIRLASSNLLMSSGAARTRDMAEQNYFSHLGPDNHTLAYFLTKAGYRYRVAGENLAMGFTDAESVVNAWIKSPTHYANLVDTDYSEFGIGLASGYYNGQPTLFVAEHFGAAVKAAEAPAARSVKAIAKVSPRRRRPPAPSAISTAPQPLALAAPTSSTVLGERVVTDAAAVLGEAESTVTMDAEHSRVYWLPKGEQTVLTARARLFGPAKSVVVMVNNYPLELSLQPNGLWAGQMTVNESPKQLFTTVVMPTITVTDEHGARFQGTIEWNDITVVSQTPVEKYLRARKLLGPVFNLFTVSRVIYGGFIALFSGVLIAMLVVEAKKRRYGVIIQTLALIGLLAWLVWV